VITDPAEDLAQSLKSFFDHQLPRSPFGIDAAAQPNAA
jgi:hypothetical protein